MDTKEEIEHKQLMADLNAEFEKAMQALNEANQAMKDFTKEVKKYIGE